jgi:hypothetical protein
MIMAKTLTWIWSVQVGDLVSPKRGRRTHWVGLVIEQREHPEFVEHEGTTECLIQWTRQPRHPAWWADWSLEVISASR